MGKVQELEIYHNGTTETTTGGKDVINNTQSSIADLFYILSSDTAVAVFTKRNIKRKENFMNQLK